MTRALGIDIGRSRIKIAEIEVGSRTRSLVGLYELERQEGLEPGNQLRDFLVTSGITADRYVFGLGAAPVYLKRVSFPFGDRKRVQGAIQAEIEDAVPFSIETYQVDHRLISKVGRLHNYLVGLCPQVWIERLNSICEAANVVPWAFHLDSEALGQLAMHQQLPAAFEGALYATVDLGYDSTKVAIVKGFMPDPQDRKAKAPLEGGEVVDFRAINKGSAELINWIKNERKVSHEEAVQWLVHRAVIKTENPNVNEKASLTDGLSDEMKVALRPIVVELYQAFQAYRGRGGEVPSAIYLTGALSDIKGLKEFFSEELRTPVYAWPIFLGFNSDRVPLTPEKERSFAVALALAYRVVVTKPRGWLNFRRSPQAARKVLSSALERLFTPEYRGLLAGCAVFALAFMTYYFATSHFVSTQFGAAESALRLELQTLGGSAATAYKKGEFSTLERARKSFEAEKLRKDAENAPKGRDPIERARAEILMDFAAALPAKALIRNIQIERLPDAIRVSGSIASTTDTADPQSQAAVKSAFESALTQRGYVEPRIAVGEGNSLEFTANWKGKSL